MKKVLSVIAALLFMLPATPAALDWGQIAARVKQSVVVLERDGKSPKCSGIVIAKQTVLSANHCWEDGKFTVDGELQEARWYDEGLDIMVLRVPALKKRPIQFRPFGVWDGMEVMAVGHAYGNWENFVRAGHVSSASTFPPDVFAEFLLFNGRNPLLKHMALDFSVIGGMSGGAIVDTDGRLISLVQMGDAFSSLSLPIDTLKAAIKKFM